MPLARNHDVVETLTTHAADHTLDVGRLPRTPGRDDHLFDVTQEYSIREWGKPSVLTEAASGFPHGGPREVE